MDELIVRLSPIAPTQTLYAIKNGSIIEEKTTTIETDKLITAITFLCNKYGLSEVKIIGNESFAKTISEELSQKIQVSKYMSNITITYYGGH